ncbi:MAG TPA: putative entry exclusion protein TrbK-alt, partial [Caulobacteraceae bacterium]|nr:putative entry exclusion protein TrbK-alt [Caulobacteraceae bacterium]
SLNPKSWGAVAAVIILLAIVLAAAITASRHARTSALDSAAGDELSAELNRCRSLGEKAENDPGCKATWERARRHFFGGDQKAPRP